MKSQKVEKKVKCPKCKREFTDTLELKYIKEENQCYDCYSKMTDSVYMDARLD